MDKQAIDQADADHERLLRDVPTKHLIQHLAARCEHMALVYVPLVDNENVYTFHEGDPDECEFMVQALFFDVSAKVIRRET